MSIRILVVDDEPSVTDLLAYNLRKAHYDVLIAGDGRQALRLAREAKPDLILLDLMLPEVDGLDVCRELRKSTAIPIIMVTALGEETDRVVGLEVGADDEDGVLDPGLLQAVGRGQDHPPGDERPGAQAGAGPVGEQAHRRQGVGDHPV